MTPALKEYEERVLTAAERIETRERELFEALRTRVGREIGATASAARAIAEPMCWRPWPTWRCAKATCGRR